ncbi:hypothetical protein ACSBR2_012109 [Camellia fascicularis]
MVIFTQGKSPYNPSCKLFKFEAAWISHEEFQTVVEDNWLNNQESFLKVFGNIFRRKRWLLGRIDGIQKSQANIHSHNLHVLEMDLIDQYNKKSRSKWITQGDKNTKFFHLLTLTKRRKRKIDVLKGQDGVWVESPEDLKMLVTNYFTNLFT